MEYWRHIAKRLTWILIFTFGFIPLGSHAQAGVLLCIEADGHITIEIAQGLKCASDLQLEVDLVEPDDHDAEEHLSEELTHCVDCIDVILKGAPDADCGSFVVQYSPEAPAPSVVISNEFSLNSPQTQALSSSEATSSELPDFHIALLSTIVILS